MFNHQKNLKDKKIKMKLVLYLFNVTNGDLCCHTCSSCHCFATYNLVMIAVDYRPYI